LSSAEVAKITYFEKGIIITISKMPSIFINDNQF
jgi:hypothetical protein